MCTARYKQIKNPIHLLQNSVTIIFCAWGTLANKFLVICYCHNVEQTGCYRVVLIKKQMLYHSNFTRDSTSTQSVTMISPIVSLRVTIFTSIFSSPLSCQDVPLLAPTPFFLEIFSIPLSKPNFFNCTFLLFNLKVKEKLLIFDLLILNCVSFYTLSLLNKLLIK